MKMLSATTLAVALPSTGFGAKRAFCKTREGGKVTNQPNEKKQDVFKSKTRE